MSDIDNYLNQFKNPKSGNIVSDSFGFISDIFIGIGQIISSKDKDNNNNDLKIDWKVK